MVTTSPWRAAQTLTVPLTGREDLRVALLDLGLIGEGAGAGDVGAGGVDGLRGDLQ